MQRFYSLAEDSSCSAYVSATHTDTRTSSYSQGSVEKGTKGFGQLWSFADWVEGVCGLNSKQESYYCANSNNKKIWARSREKSAQTRKDIQSLWSCIWTWGPLTQHSLFLYNSHPFPPKNRMASCAGLAQSQTAGFEPSFSPCWLQVLRRNALVHSGQKDAKLYIEGIHIFPTVPCAFYFSHVDEGFWW